MSVSIPFSKELEFEYGTTSTLSPLIRRVVAENPSAFTLHGTGTYILGRGNVAVIDPGPIDAAHTEAILRATEGETITHILITHTHNDHSPGAAPLKERTGAKTYGYGPHGSGKPGMKAEEGGDMAFVPDVEIRDRDVIEGDGWSVRAIHTPGHLSNHICFELIEENTLFSGDHVMGWSTSIVSPPDGDMKDYIASLEKLLDYPHRKYWPTHGPAIEDPHAFVQGLIAHRHDRMNQIRTCLQSGPMDIPSMVRKMYTDVPEYLHPAAARSVYSHIIMMVENGEVSCDGQIEVHDTYSLA
ncbi:MBL fold metallo-hydrolase [Sneathiella chinensis]|uniref:MBL fold metallo-hydrolase n=1 Tax=Sneathiella chinensis TaxID=349750 RepID=A0ABQ5U2I0_9PROT|nr:MBL fold metallo-hydrolase [Sneathiella chinensis]GLQ06392.1 MBL fold metallo-hydrolase [Sneathiella chinensis]